MDKTVDPALTNEWKLRMQQENENIKTGTDMFALQQCTNVILVTNENRPQTTEKKRSEMTFYVHWPITLCNHPSFHH